MGSDAQRLGARLRALRRSRALTLVQLGAATGLSHPFLSQVERGRANLSLESLRKVAVALETSPVELMAAADADPERRGRAVEVVRAGEGTRTPHGFATGDALALAHPGRPFMPIVVEGAATPAGLEAWPTAAFVHDEQEFVYVLDGGVVLEADGQPHALAAGDAIFLAGGVAHRVRSAGPSYRLLVVKQQPR